MIALFGGYNLGAGVNPMSRLRALQGLRPGRAGPASPALAANWGFGRHCRLIRRNRHNRLVRPTRRAAAKSGWPGWSGRKCLAASAAPLNESSVGPKHTGTRHGLGDPGKTSEDQTQSHDRRCTQGCYN